MFITHKSSERCKATASYSSNTGSYTFRSTLDNYDGVTVDLSQEHILQKDFKEYLDNSLKKWKEEGRRCIWFKVDIKNSFCVPALGDIGFNFHHGKAGFVVMYKWLPPTKPNLPPASHTNMGVGAMVFNNKQQILAISEKHYNYPHWKLPGGYIENGEDIITAAIREVKEETGVDTKFESLVTFRHTHNMMFNNSDVYLILRMSALTYDISKSSREINDCKWMDIDEYINHPHVHKWNSFVVRKALEHQKKGLRLDIQRKTVKFANNVRIMDVLMLENL